jgi:hypothetical protein
MDLSKYHGDSDNDYDSSDVSSISDDNEDNYYNNDDYNNSTVVKNGTSLDQKTVVSVSKNVFYNELSTFLIKYGLKGVKYTNAVDKLKSIGKTIFLSDKNTDDDDDDDVDVILHSTIMSFINVMWLQDKPTEYVSRMNKLVDYMLDENPFLLILSLYSSNITRDDIIGLFRKINKRCFIFSTLSGLDYKTNNLRSFDITLISFLFSRLYYLHGLYLLNANDTSSFRAIPFNLVTSVVYNSIFINDNKNSINAYLNAFLSTTTTMTTKDISKKISFFYDLNNYYVDPFNYSGGTDFLHPTNFGFLCGVLHTHYIQNGVLDKWYTLNSVNVNDMRIPINGYYYDNGFTMTETSLSYMITVSALSNKKSNITSLYMLNNEEVDDVIGQFKKDDIFSNEKFILNLQNVYLKNESIEFNEKIDTIVDTLKNIVPKQLFNSSYGYIINMIRNKITTNK